MAVIGTDIPFVIQIIIGAYSCDEPKVIRRIVMDNPSCVMLKHEDWPGLKRSPRCALFNSTDRSGRFRFYR